MLQTPIAGSCGGETGVSMSWTYAPMTLLRSRVPVLMETALCMLAIELVVRIHGLLPCRRAISAVERVLRVRRARHPAVIPGIVRSLETVSQRLPGRHACLSQALTGLVMLRRRGLAVQFHLGVGQTPPADGPVKLVAHAWISYQGRVITGGPLTGLTPLPQLPPMADLARSSR